jgi:hypothetical protein
MNAYEIVTIGGAWMRLFSSDISTSGMVFRQRRAVKNATRMARAMQTAMMRNGVCV